MDPLSCFLSFGLLCTPAPKADTAPAPEVPTTTAPEPTEAPAKTATEVLVRVQRYHDRLGDLTARFRQVYASPVYGTRAESTGVLYLKRPGKMVWDYDKPEDPDFYADGKTLWVVERDTRQVVKKDVANSDFAGAVEFLFGGQKLLDAFYVRFASDALSARYGMAGHVVVELKPKKPNAHYKRLLLVADPRSGRVDAFVVRNSDDSINHFVLSDMRPDSGLPDAKFRFRPPAGYDVVEE